MIKVKYSKGLYMIWNASDAVEIRQKHRIIGSLIGTLPTHPRQNDLNGLPLILSNEEVRLLQSLGVITIVEQQSLRLNYTNLNKDNNNNKSIIEYQNELNENFYNEIRKKLLDERREQIMLNIDKIVMGKLKKLKLNIINNENNDEYKKYRNEILTEMLTNLKEPNDNDIKDRIRFYIESPYNNLYKNENVIQLKKFNNNNNNNNLDKLKYLTFKYFWSRGYFITNGLKFGAHFLIYDNDPILFHAKFIVYCCGGDLIEFQNQFIKQQRMIQAYGRLGKNVRKNVIIVHYNNNGNDNNDNDEDDENNIRLEHIQWNPMIFNEEQQH